MIPKPVASVATHLRNRSAADTVLCLCMNPAVDLATETERVVPTHKLRCADTLHDAGGGGINVARVLTRLDMEAKVVTVAGGPTGEWLRRRLQEDALPAMLLPIQGETRISFTVHEAQSGAEFRFVMPGPALNDAEWRACLVHLDQLDPWPCWLVASGSLPPGVPVDFYARVVRLCRQHGARLVLDTAGEPLAAALEEGVDLVKPNLRELRALSGQPLAEAADWQAAAQALVATGKARHVALTLGPLGAVLATREGLWQADPLPIRVASAVGAGDSFVAGMVWGLARGLSALDAFTWGTAAGSAALLTAGTGLCDPAQVRAWQPRVQVRPVPGATPLG